VFFERGEDEMHRPKTSLNNVPTTAEIVPIKIAYPRSINLGGV
jgi:hypothetical protein